ncbi:hypothetical protein COCMIDRAFT_95217 [Bipolaris oryzae ATCC 44560]|uniref:Uncharacterized protein n=1 Tax=Bipolaris oryzae ATCC 44560 TaxID=930090 RepID=W6Z1B0_COCMI|nr:uncharacterized protein COCMIDRAFT_95217 [Bipolaris oryzae ATCC 44560]EUC45547.1 hypothetical protein COCMIDRAFT_95217 [Bipolaris oryzae ATCC 44560]
MALHAIVVLTASLRDAKRRDWHRDAQLTAQTREERKEIKKQESSPREPPSLGFFPSEDIGGKKNTNENESRGYEWPTRKTPSSTAPQRHTLNVCEY